MSYHQVLKYKLLIYRSKSLPLDLTPTQKQSKTSNRRKLQSPSTPALLIYQGCAQDLIKRTLDPRHLLNPGKYL